MAKKQTAAVSPGIRVRNVGLRTVRVADIEDHDLNFRTHPTAQRDALAGAVAEIGWYGYPDCYTTADGNVRLIDGHLRKAHLIEKYGPDATIEVNVTDFDEAEARKAMLTHDPLAAMAEMDSVKLDELLRSVETGDEALSKMLADLATDAGLYTPDAEPPADFATVDESIPIEHVCPRCQYRFSGGVANREAVEQ